MLINNESICHAYTQCTHTHIVTADNSSQAPEVPDHNQYFIFTEEAKKKVLSWG